MRLLFLIITNFLLATHLLCSINLAIVFTLLFLYITFFVAHLLISAFEVSVLPTLVRCLAVVLLFLLLGALDGQWVVLVSLRKVVELLVLRLVIGVHKAVAHVDHVHLSGLGGFKTFTASEAELAHLDTFSQVGQQALKVYQAVDVQDEEPVLLAHVVQIIFYRIELFVREKTHFQRV